MNDGIVYQGSWATIDLAFKPRFVEMFGDICEDRSPYNMKPIRELCSGFLGGGTPSMKHPEYYDGGDIPWLKSGDIKSLKVESGALHITQAGLSNSSAKMVPAGTVVVVTRSGILKHTLPVAIAVNPVAINQDLKALIPGDTVISEYLQWALLVAEPLILSKVRATTADNIETSYLKNFELPVPPMTLQHEFAAFVQQVDKLEFLLVALYPVGSFVQSYHLCCNVGEQAAATYSDLLACTKSLFSRSMNCDSLLSSHLVLSRWGIVPSPQ